MVSDGIALPAGGTWFLESMYVGSEAVWLCVVVRIVKVF